MGRRTVSLVDVSLVAAGDDGNLILELGPEPHGRRYKCSVGEWPTGEVEVIEQQLSRYRMPIVHGGERFSYFWVRTRHLMTAIGLVIEAFQGVYEFDPPGFWYHTPDEDPDSVEMKLEDREPYTHTKLLLECTNWRNHNDPDREEQLDAFEAALRRSDLCVPAETFRDGNEYYVRLTGDAGATPLESFLAIANLHPRLAHGNGTARTA